MRRSSLSRNRGVGRRIRSGRRNHGTNYDLYESHGIDVQFALA